MTLLPADPKTPWPLPQVGKAAHRWPLLAAWLAGDPSQLASVYGSKPQESTSSPGTTINPPGVVRRVVSALTGRTPFWMGAAASEETTKRHLGVAQDIAQISSELLFSEPLKITVQGPVITGDGENAGDPTPETRAAQQRLERVLERCNFHSTLLAAAEISSALGFTGLRVVFDKAGPIPDMPMIDRGDADAVIPFYSHGILVGVIFWRVVRHDKNDVIERHLELHQGGSVYHALYRGDSGRLGARIGLDQNEATAGLAGSVNEAGMVFTLGPKARGRTGVSIPNVLPDPLDRQSRLGRSDFTPTVLDLFDAIDKTYTEMMDTIDDAKSRLFLADSMVSKGRPGEGTSFDSSQRIFHQVKVPPSEKETANLPIEKVQFDMRVAEYKEAIEFLADRALHEAGYNAQVMGDDGDVQMTATQYSGKNKRSMSTRDKKSPYWSDQLGQLLTGLLETDVQEFAPFEEVDGQQIRVQAFPVRVEFPEAVQPSQLELIATAKALKEAEAGTTEDRVRMAQPGLSAREIKTKADEIDKAGRVSVDPVSFGAAGQGVGPGDGI